MSNIITVSRQFGSGGRELGKRHPFNIFVYADMPSRKERCRKRAPEDEELSDRELEKKIRQVDADRAKSLKLVSNTKWGDKDAYHLCVNTSGLSIKEITPYVAAYAKHWLERKEK